MTLLRKLADQEDGKLTSQSNPLTGVWMPDSLMDQRWGGGQAGRKGNKVKRPLILQASPRMASLRQGDVFVPSCHLQVARVLNKGTSV